jgi:hypothetical protein
MTPWWVPLVAVVIGVALGYAVARLKDWQATASGRARPRGHRRKDGASRYHRGRSRLWLKMRTGASEQVLEARLAHRRG